MRSDDVQVTEDQQAGDAHVEPVDVLPVDVVPAQPGSRRPGRRAVLAGAGAAVAAVGVAGAAARWTAASGGAVAAGGTSSAVAGGATAARVPLPRTGGPGGRAGTAAAARGARPGGVGAVGTAPVAGGLEVDSAVGTEGRGGTTQTPLAHAPVAPVVPDAPVAPVAPGVAVAPPAAVSSAPAAAPGAVAPTGRSTTPAGPSSGPAPGARPAPAGAPAAPAPGAPPDAGPAPDAALALGRLPREEPSPEVPSTSAGVASLVQKSVAGPPAAWGAGLVESGAASLATPVTSPGTASLQHFLRRTTYGVTDALLEQVQRGGRSAWLSSQLQPSRIDDGVCDEVLASRLPLLGVSAPELWATSRFGWDAMNQVALSQLVRATWSERQLLETVVETWQDHLHITCPSSDVWDSRADYDRVLRRHALGRFSDLLAGCVLHPAMLRYLDAASSTTKHPNENLGRELLELHTVGREAGYTQRDVVDCALALTGLSTWTPWNGGAPEQLGLLRVKDSDHRTGPLRVLGWTHPNAPGTPVLDVARSLVSYLARHPSTATRVARRLAVRFVADDPPTALTDRLAAVYLQRGTRVAPVLRTLFGSAEFAASAGAKQRRPVEDLVATARTLGLRPSADGRAGRWAVQSWYWALRDAGHQPLRWSPPDGYPDRAEAWSSAGTVVSRWNLHLALVDAWWPDGVTKVDHASYLPATRPATRGALVDAVAARLLREPLRPAQRAAVAAFLGGTVDSPVKDADVTWRLPALLTLVLDAQQWVRR